MIIPYTTDEVATRTQVENQESISHLAHKNHELANDAALTLLIGRDSEDFMWCHMNQKVSPFCFETKLGSAVVRSLCPAMKSLTHASRIKTRALF